MYGKKTVCSEDRRCVKLLRVLILVKVFSVFGCRWFLFTNEVPVLRWQTDAGAREILRSEEKHTLGRECLFNRNIAVLFVRIAYTKAKPIGLRLISV